MPKFSFIVPVYNTEKYLKRCLDSIKSQTLDDYEVIVVDDGSTDNSRQIINEYLSDKRFKYIYQENSGLSEARNTGIEHSTGCYLLFLDSDDYVFCKLCEIIDKNIEENIDVIKFQCKYIYDDAEKCVNDGIVFSDTGSNVLLKLIEIKSLLEPAWLYAYRRQFWIENNFKYMKNIYHEDFALTPYILSKAKHVKVIDDNMYYYVQVQNSITRDTNYNKIRKKVYDMMLGFEFNYEKINNNAELSDEFKRVFNSYLANIVINKGQELNNSDKKEYYLDLKKRKIYDLLIADSIPRKLKKLLLKLNRKLYFKICKR